MESNWSGLKERVISGVLLASIALVTLLAGGWLFDAMVVFAALIMMREWDRLTEHDTELWQKLGYLYVALPTASLIWLRGYGANEIFYLLLCVAATDIGAYFSGRIIGGPKLAPRVSPNKTWAGLGGGMLAAALVGALCHSFTYFPQTLFGCAGMGLVIALLAQAGDLFESWLKRRVGVKDSGDLLPGHGGLLDRVDGLIFTTPLLTLLVFFYARTVV